MIKLKRLWSGLRGSFWFVPSLVVALSIALAVALIALDSTESKPWMEHWPRLFGSGAEGARGVLSTIAGSMMTVVGVTFSMTLVTLALASSQFTSRILRNFMRDRVTQLVLGIFAGIFTYCLIVLRTIRGGDEVNFVPSLSVTFGVVLAIGGIGVLIFFIHHIASAIQASTIIAAVASETIHAVDRLFPEELGQAPGEAAEDPAEVLRPRRNWRPVPARVGGYIQSVDNAALLRVAREHETVVRMERGVGEFVVRDTALASIALEAPPSREIVAQLQAAYGMDRHRTVNQDVAFGIGQIVDIALRALSPGVNDTTTAVMCVDHLTSILARLASRPIPSSYRYEEEELRVIAVGPTFDSLVGDAFDQIRGSARANVAVLIRLLVAIRTIAGLTDRPSRWQVLFEHVEAIGDVADRSIESPRDRQRFESELASVHEGLETASASARVGVPLTRSEFKETGMPLRFDEEDGGRILAIHVSGKLTREDYAQLVPEVERLVRQHGKLRLLFDMAGFHGWELGAAWEDVKLGIAHSADIERLAMVGETRWQEGMARFSKPFTKAEVRYFDQAEAAEARNWLGEA